MQIPDSNHHDNNEEESKKISTRLYFRLKSSSQNLVLIEFKLHLTRENPKFKVELMT